MVPQPSLGHRPAQITPRSVPWTCQAPRKRIMRHVSFDLLAPVARTAFLGLDAYLRRETRFRCFETYRDPAAQAVAFAAKTSKAAPFESAHQFGLAADFVVWRNKQWHWPATDDPEWDALRRAAHDFGLINGISWDRPHVEHPSWAGVRKLTRKS